MCTISILTVPSVLPEKAHVSARLHLFTWVKRAYHGGENPFYIGEKINATKSCRHCTRTFDGHSPQKVHCLPGKKDDFFQEAFPGRNPPSPYKSLKNRFKNPFSKKKQLFSHFFFKTFGEFKISPYLCIAKQKRNVAQLVAHYVRDVGVGRSNRLFPTTHGLFVITSNLQAFFISIYMQLKESDTNLT